MSGTRGELPANSAAVLATTQNTSSRAGSRRVSEQINCSPASLNHWLARAAQRDCVTARCHGRGSQAAGGEVWRDLLRKHV